MKIVSVSSLFRVVFSKLGYCIGTHTKYFIIVPVLVSLVLTLGALRFKYVNDIEYLFTLEGGEAKKEVAEISEFFPQNTSLKFSPSRLLGPGRFARLIITKLDGGSLIDTDAWEEIIALDEYTRGISIEWEGTGYNYSELCASWKGVCYHNDHLGLSLVMDKIVNGTVRLSYPIFFNPENYETYYLNLFLGGIKFKNDANTTIQSFEALSIDYFAKYDTPEDYQKAIKWENAIIDNLLAAQSRWKTIKVDFTTYASIGIELESNTLSAFKYLAISYVLMTIFVMGTSYTGDWVTSKSLVAVMGMASATLGGIAGVGVLFILGVPFISLNATVPFVAIGVGIDDTFVMLASWWKTSRKDSVSQRMAHCYSESAVSITITTLTDMLSFYVGLLSPVPSIKIFCAYAGTTVLFIYIWHIFFFGGILALSGHFEEQRRHSLFLWRKVDTKNVVKDAGQTGNETNNDDTKKQTKENKLMSFFKNCFAPFLQNKISQAAIIAIYIVYIGLSIWGILNMKEGLQTSNLAQHDSYMAEYFRKFDKYFREYPYRSQLVIMTPLDYSQPEVQANVQRFIHNVTSIKGMTTEYSENWLTNFLQFTKNYQEVYNFNITNEQEFIDVLRNYYINDNKVDSYDIKFNDNFTKIIATRYAVQHYKQPDADSEKYVLMKWREYTADEKSMNITLFHPFNDLIDITVILASMTIKLVAIASLIVMIVAFIFIPNVTSALCVFLSIASVELGVLGFMVFWGISLDTISVVTLIMCIGFSVDFPAHITYAYISSKFKTVEERVEETVYSLGLPIMQGSISTIIAVSGMFVVNSYIFQTFFRIVTLVMIFSVFNALFVLPVILLILKPDAKRDSTPNDKTTSVVISRIAKIPE